MSDKITIDQLKNYLGTGLEMRHPWNQKIWTLDHLNSTDETIQLNTAIEINAIPMCYSTYDFATKIPELGFTPIEELLKLAVSQIWGTLPFEPTKPCEVLTEYESAGIIAWENERRISFTIDKDTHKFDFDLYIDGSRMNLDK